MISFLTSYAADFSMVILYLAITLWIGITSGKSIHSFRDFAVAHKNYPTSVIVATLAATMIGGFFTFGIAEKVFSVGPIYILVACPLLAGIFGSKRGPSSFLWSFFMGVITVCLWDTYLKESSGVDALFPGIVASALAFFAISPGSISQPEEKGIFNKHGIIETAA